MNIKVEYYRDEVEAIILEHHKRVFGQPPDGEEWHCSGGYGEFTIRNILLPKNNVEKEE